MPLTPNAASNGLTLDDLLSRLSVSEHVDGVALFGSRANQPGNPVSDYDLLILVDTMPIGIFQMLTHVDGHMADILFVTTNMVDQIVADPQPVAAESAAGRFLLKMQTALIVHDASGRLRGAQAIARGDRSTGDWLLPTSYSGQYAAWFWQNFVLCHVKRMVQTDDPVYLTAVDLMLLAALGDICRAYYRIRHLPWEGEKAAIRYLQQQDANYLALLRECLAAADRAGKVQLYEKLVAATLAPIGGVWQPGLTAVYLEPAANAPAEVETALEFWESLCENHGRDDLHRR
jgi:predicted nucleotidyltransferase